MTSIPQTTARRAPDTMFDTIRDRICLRIYAPGAVLYEGALAEEFGVSRTPVRAVLQRLSAAGLVEAKNGVGTIVMERTREEVRQIYALRIRIAMLIGDMSPRKVDADDLRQMAALLDRARALVDAGTGWATEDYWRINHEAHFTIGDLIGNEPLREIWDRCYFQIASYWYGVLESDTDAVANSLCRELEDILEAMKRNDVAAVGFIERNFISYGLKRVEEQLRSPSPDHEQERGQGMSSNSISKDDAPLDAPPSAS